MNPNTKDHLREAVINALREKEDESAFELLVLLMPVNSQPNLLQPFQSSSDSSFPPLPLTNDGRRYHFWVAAIKDYYLPHLSGEGITQFSSSELYSWFESVGFPFTSGDMKLDSDGREYWKNRVGKALSVLCESEVIWRHGVGSPNYTTIKPNPVLRPASV